MSAVDSKERWAWSAFGLGGVSEQPCGWKSDSGGENVHASRGDADREKLGMKLMDDSLQDLLDKGLITGRKRIAEPRIKRCLRQPWRGNCDEKSHRRAVFYFSGEGGAICIC